jgi:rhamnogalacturonyl hydrolase YesR
MEGEAVWYAARITNDPILKNAADDMLEYVLKRAPRAADGTIYHMGEMHWSDSFHTTPPFLAFSGYHDECIAQIDGHKKRLWDSRKKLLSHQWDERNQQFKRRDFWGGGNGWAAAALARIIRALPEEKDSKRKKLAEFLKEIIDGCLVHQRADGLFHDIVDNPDSFVETNLAQMLAFSIYESVRGGWLPREYLKAADRMRAAARAKIDKDGFVQGVSGAPTFDKSGISTEGQAFFLMMEASHQKLVMKKAIKSFK